MAASNSRLRRVRGHRARKVLLTAVLSGISSCTASLLHAQGTTATLGGTVTDPSGAVIPNANVTLKNQASGDTRQGRSNSAGDFTFQASRSAIMRSTSMHPASKRTRPPASTSIRATNAVFARSS